MEPTVVAISNIGAKTAEPDEYSFPNEITQQKKTQSENLPSTEQ
jgi:hypothetical protein